MTVKELIFKLSSAASIDAEVIINTRYGDLPVVTTIGCYTDEFIIETVE